MQLRGKCQSKIAYIKSAQAEEQFMLRSKGENLLGKKGGLHGKGNDSVKLRETLGL